MKLKLYILSTILLASTLFISCKKKDKDPEPEPEPTPTLATVGTAAVSSITENSAISGGNVTTDGISAITAIGICWDTITSPTTSKPHSNNGSSAGTFTSAITGLLSNKTYYVRAYATNGLGTAYGNEISFKTTPAWILANPSNNQTYSAMVGLGSKLFGNGNQVVKVSNNNGATWTNSGASLNANINSLFVNGTDIFAGCSTGVFKSSDNGTTWVNSSSGMPASPDIRGFTVQGSTIFACGIGSGVFRSTDNGNSWTVVNTGITNLQVLRLATIGTTIFAGAVNGGGCFRSTDNGNTWAPINTGLSDLFIYWFTTTGTKLFTANNSGIFVSNDNGSTWIEPNSSFDLDINGLGGGGIVSYNNNLYCSMGGNLFMSTDFGANWSTINQGLGGPKTVSAMTINGTSLIISTVSGGIYNYPLQ